VLNKLAKGIFRVPGISRVQSVTRPEGTPIEHTSIPFLISIQNAGQVQNLDYIKARMSDLLTQSDYLTKQIKLMNTLWDLTKALNDATHHSIVVTKEVVVVTEELQDAVANFEDMWRPLRSYFYWEKHCYDIPICWSIRSIFDTLDGVDELTEKMQELVKDLDVMDALLPQLLEQFPVLISVLHSTQTMLLTMHSTMMGTFSEMDASNQNVTAMGQAFDAAKNDDSFYLPPEVFKNHDFQRAIKSFLSPDGKAARFIISQRGDPATPRAIARVEKIKIAAEEALKGTPLANAKIYIGGAAATYKDWRDGSKYDLLIAGVSALCLIFIIMLIITRSFVAALVIVGTVALSLGASFGLSVLIWQYLLGMQLFWMVLPMSVIILLAVGSDYNLLLVSRFKEELSAGLNTGMIRSMGGTGKVVTTAGLVFAFTMASMVVSELRVIGQIGSTIGLGLLFDTLIVRSFMTPSIAALLGRWFWWPQVVRPRPASYLLESLPPRSVVRSLLLREDGPARRGHVTDDFDTQPLNLVGNGHHRQVRVPDRFGDAQR
jgi:putative drug exporter of the RND superfamily